MLYMDYVCRFDIFYVFKSIIDRGLEWYDKIKLEAIGQTKGTIRQIPKCIKQIKKTITRRYYLAK